MRKIILLTLFTINTLTFAQNGISLTFSEIMFYTTSAENSEFVEIYNTSSSTTVDLSTIKILYDGSNKPFEEYNGGGYQLAPQKYAVIFESDVDLSSGVYAGQIPGDALILVRTVTTWGLHNSADKTLEIRNSSDEVLDTYTYSASNSRNYSDEKISMKKDNTSGNWADSGTEYGTPGGTNSATPRQYDLSVSSLTFNPTPAYKNNNLEITATITNSGMSSAVSYLVTIYEDLDNDGIADAGEELATEKLTNLAAGSSTTVSTNKNSILEDTYRFIAVITYAQDQNTGNNSKDETITVYPEERSYKDIVINEIMYDPVSGQPEWIELFNTSNDDINIKLWSISDAVSSKVISTSDLAISSGSYFVLVDDADVNTKYNITSDKLVIALPSLNNSGDGVILKDLASKTIDSVAYESSWGDADEISLERVTSTGESNNSSNWGISSAPDGATPGDVNSLSSKQFDVAVTAITTSPTYIIDGGDAAISVVTENLGTSTANSFTTKIFYDANSNDVADAGEEIFSQDYTNVNSGDFVTSDVSINGLGIGTYKLIVEVTYAADEFTANNALQKTFQVIETPSAINDIIISEIMYDPNTGEPEWIELYNQTNSDINIKKWKIGDANSAVEISDVDMNISANDYLVLTDDASVSIIFTIPSAVVVLNLPALNNGGDDVKLIDTLSRAIDSVAYTSSWGGDDGVSLERKRAEIASNLNTNWDSSIDATGGTPGKENSIKTMQYDLTIDSFEISPAIIYSIDDARIILSIKNIGYTDAANYNLKVYHDKNNNNNGDADEIKFDNNYTTLAVDVTKDIYINLGELNVGTQKFIAIIEYGDDQRTGNNTQTKSVNVRLATTYFNDIVINEIMYKPNSGEPEWLELYNRTTEEIDIRSYKLGSTDPSVTITNRNNVIPAKGYVIVSESESINDLYNITAEVFTVDLFSLSNKSDQIVLYDENDRRIDYVSYRSEMGGNDGGVSLERKSAHTSSSFTTNWRSSNAPDGATPGYANFATPIKNDLALINFSVERDSEIEESEVQLKVTVENADNQPSTDYVLNIYNDINNNSIAETEELVFNNNYNALSGRSKFIHPINLNKLTAGEYNYIASIVPEQDPRVENNTSTFSFIVLPSPQEYNNLVVSEIMHSPLSGNPEWIEIFNHSGSSINIFNWRVADRTSSVLLPGFTIPSGGYVIISDMISPSNSTLSENNNSNMIYVSLPSLNNSGDDVKIFDAQSNLIDSVSYQPSWGGGSGYSLERKFSDISSNDGANWESSLSVGGSAGSKNSITPEEHDLEVLEISLDRVDQFEGTKIDFYSSINNAGQSRAENYSINYYITKNYGDEEFLVSKKNVPIASSDSLTIKHSINDLLPGSYKLRVLVEYILDTDLTNNENFIEFEVLKTPSKFGDLVINEIMYDPPGQTPEWIEVFNASDETIDLLDWQIGDVGKTVTITSNISVAPNEYAILTNFTIGLENYFIGGNYLVFSLPSLNNSGDEVLISNQYGDIIDSLNYSSTWGGKNVSLERRSTNHPTNDFNNWKPSDAEFGATPGFENTVVRKKYDLIIKDIHYTRESEYVGTKSLIEIEVVNEGLEASSKYGFELFVDENKNNTPEISERIYLNNFERLQPGETNIINFNYNQNQAGNISLLARVNFSGDERESNNFNFVTFAVATSPYKFNDIVITEIMYNPVSGAPEWIEVFNRTNKSINLNNWKIKDPTASASLTETKIESKGFAVISDSEEILNQYNIEVPLLIINLPSLNNDADKIYLINNLNNIIDSLNYNSSWGVNKKGVSLERISVDSPTNDSLNWQSSYDESLATPGKPSSTKPIPDFIDAGIFDLTLNKEILSDKDTLVTNLVLKNLGDSTITNIQINYELISETDTIYTNKNIEYLSINDSIKIIQNFINIKPGKYLINVSCLCKDDVVESNNKLSSQFSIIAVQSIVEFGAIKINEIMFAPENSEPEWIEFVNTSSKEINLNNFTIQDKSSSNGQIKESVTVKPNEYFIIADNSTFEQFYSIEQKVIVVSIPSLNNSGDRILLSDSFGNPIDSVNYLSSWGGRNGKSLERISLLNSSTDETNWETSINDLGATPGKINSITGGWFDWDINEFYSESNFTILPEKLNAKIKYQNIGISSTGNSVLYIYNDYNFDSTFVQSELIDSINIASLNAGETKEVDVMISFTNSGSNLLAAVIIDSLDHNGENNIAFLKHNVVKLNEVFGDILVNEIMYSPISGESEWVELYNVSDKTIDLNGYQLADSRSDKRIIEETVLLKPGEYFVVANDSSVYSEFEVKSKSVIVKFPSLNNSGDRIIISDSLNRAIDSLIYTSDWGGATGVSLEKTAVNLVSNNIESWGTAKEELRGTPGTINSLTTGWIDLAITDFYANNEVTLLPNDFNGFIEVKNFGVKTATNNKIYFYNDINLDSINQQHELIDSLSILDLNKEGIAQVEVNVKNLEAGENQIIALLVNNEDENLTNNKAWLKHRALLINEKRGDIVINEFMNYPNSGSSEWVELYNNSDKEINLLGYSIADNRSQKVFCETDFLLKPESFLLIARDSSLLSEYQISSDIIVTSFSSLNNDEDEIVIRNYLDKVIDSLSFTKEWVGSQGSSIEKTAPWLNSSDINNWKISSSGTGATPGNSNSTSQKNYDLTVASISVSPQNPKINDEIGILITIKNVGKMDFDQFNLDISKKYIDDKVLIETITNSSIGAGDSITISNNAQIFVDKEFELLVVLNNSNDQTKNNDTIKTKIVPSHFRNSLLITEFMFNPLSGEPEWIEVMNNSENSIDITEWKISDLLTNPSIKTITYNENIIEPNEFFVVAPDSNVYGLNPEAKFFDVNFSSLGNSGDGIMLYDKLGNVIDSLEYNSDWGSMKGQSIERISLDDSSTSKLNWKQSISANNGTPGFPNSLWNVADYERNSIVINEIMANPNDDNSEFIEVYNRSEEYVEIGGWTITDNSGKSVRISDYNYELPPNEYFVFSSDTSILYNYSWLIDEGNYQIASSSFALTNSGEVLMLRDLWGNVIDSLKYSDGWNNKNISFTKNKSLERISPHIKSNQSDNWSTSVSEYGATPGIENSIFNNGLSTETKLSISPNPFSPDADGFEDNTIISYNLTQAIAQIRVRVFDSRGRQVRTLASNRSSGSQGQIIFNGFDDNGIPLRIGIYVLFIEALNSNSGVVETIKEAVVIARKI